MKTETKNKLESLIGKKFKKDSREFTVKGFKKVGQLIVLLTSNGSHNFKEEETDLFIAALKLVVGSYTPVSVAQVEEVHAPIVYQKTETHQKLEDALKSMIDKVMKTKDAIPQASALCNLTNTMINLEKQQLNMLRAAKKLH